MGATSSGRGPERAVDTLWRGEPDVGRGDVRGKPVNSLRSRACVKALLRRGADVNYAAADGATPLIAAASAVHKGVCRLLLKRGANALAQLKSGEFPSQVTPKTPHGRMLKHGRPRGLWRSGPAAAADVCDAAPPRPVSVTRRCLEPWVCDAAPWRPVLATRRCLEPCL